MKRYQRSTTFLKETIDIPMSITLTKADCDDLVEAVTKVCDAYS
jgi:dTDP-4-amino-4,6-dideoxygalactose transaminase